MTQRLRQIAGCAGGNCPAVYALEGDETRFVVQGDAFALNTPPGEQAVVAPVDLLRALLVEMGTGQPVSGG